MIRQTLRPDYYTPSIPQVINGHEEDGLYGPRHMGHCIEQLRQAIMCHSDVTPYTWVWDEKEKHLRNENVTPHTCRNFDKIRDWAVAHKAERDLDFFKYVEGAPLRQE